MSFKWLRDFGVSFSAHTFEPYTTDIGHLDVQNTVPEMLQIGPNLCVVCLSHRFPAPFFGPGRWTYSSVFRKIIVQKRGLAAISVGEAENFRPTLPRSLHSPQMTPAARPLFGFFGWWRDAVGDMHLWRHLPPRVPF